MDEVKTRDRVRCIRVAKFCELTGYTEKAIERKRQEGIWREGFEYHKAPDGNILIDLDGYESWAMSGKPHTTQEWKDGRLN